MLLEELRSHRDSLRRLQSAEPTWRRDDRARGLLNDNDLERMTRLPQ